MDATKLLRGEDAAAKPIVPITTCPAAIGIPTDFQISEVDSKHSPNPSFTTPTPAPLGVLTNFTGDFAGTGFNLIFRPNNTPTMTPFPKPVHPTPPEPPSQNVLELNLMTETLSFLHPLGSIPNRGLDKQSDIFLNGVPYVQTVSDVTNIHTGKADCTPTGIHWEPGLWMHVPATTVDPKVGESLRDTPRLPQDLTKFIAEGTITQAILTDPNTVLRNDNVGKTITNTISFTVAANPPKPELGGGVASIAFLRGAEKPNANAAHMSATFWIETVQHEIRVPPFKPGQAYTLEGLPGARVPVFEVSPPDEITEPITIVAESTQIQYSQTVFLDFAGLIWPHVSVATLVPTGLIKVPASTFN